MNFVEYLNLLTDMFKDKLNDEWICLNLNPRE